MKRSLVMPEDDLQANVVKLLQAYARRDVCWWHCPNGEKRPKATGKRLKLAGVRRGAADLMFVIAGKFHGVELKTESGVQSDYQESFQTDLERAGGFYHLAFGMDQALGVLAGLGVFRPGISFTAPPSTGVGRKGGRRRVAPTVTSSPRETAAPA